MFCELLIFTITISRYGYSTCMYTIFKFAKYCKIPVLISCTNKDQIPYFCQVYIPDIIYKMHEGEIDSPHKEGSTVSHLHKSSVFYLLMFTICLWGEQADRKQFDLRRCSIHNADIYIVHSPFGNSENRGGNLIKNWILFFIFFLYRYFILYTIYKLEQIFTDFFNSKYIVYKMKCL